MSQEPDRKKELEEAVETYQGRLLSLVRGLIRDQIEAEDVIQDVFEELAIAYDLGVVIEKLGAWLMTVARNKVFDRHRRKKTREKFEEQLTYSTDATRQPDDEWERAQLREIIVTGVELLPPEQRQVFVMYELEGMSFKEIAAQTGLPLGTLLARKKYAVDFLRNYLKEVFYEFK
ncbi:MAG: RNA polymerase sigma factor [Oligoflexales bacterium]